MAETTKAVYIFKSNSLLKPDDMARVREILKAQIKDGLVLHDSRISYVGQEIIIEGHTVVVEVIPGNHFAGAGGKI